MPDSPANKFKKLRPDHPDAKAGAAKAELDLLREQIIDLISKDPAKAAIILTQWLNQPSAAARKKSRKAG